MTGSELLSSFRRWWRLVALLGALGFVLGGAWAELRPAYVSSATLIVSPQNELQRQEFLSAPDRFIETQIRILMSGPVLGQASARIDGTPSVATLQSVLSVSGGSVDDTIDIVAHGETAKEARQVAQEAANAYTARSAGIASVLEFGGSGRATNPVRLVAGATLGGLGIGGLLVLVLENTGRLVEGPPSIQIPGMNVFPVPLTVRQKPLGARSRRRDAAEHGVESLAAWLVRNQPQSKRLLVTSLGRPDLSRWVAIELARVMSIMGRTAALLDSESSGEAMNGSPDIFGEMQWLEGSTPGVEIKIADTGAIGQSPGVAYLSLAADQTLILVSNRSCSLAHLAAEARSLAGRSSNVTIAIVIE